MPKKVAEKKEKKLKPSVKEVQKPSPEQGTTIESLPEPQVPMSTSVTTPAPAVTIVVDQPTGPTVAQNSSETSLSQQPQVETQTPPQDIPTIPNTEIQPVAPTIVSPAPETPLTGTTTESDDFEPEKKGNGMKILLIFLTALLVGGGAVGGFLFFSHMPPKQTTPTQPTTPATTPLVSPTEPIASDSAGIVDVSSYSVQILNGAGVAGEASKVRDALESAGFTKFSLGNADSYDFTDTEVQMKIGLPASIFSTIKDALSDYSVVEKDNLPKTGSNDIVIVVGKQK